MDHKLDRRQFLTRSTVLGASLAALSSPAGLRSAQSPAEKLVVGVMGLGRGHDHVRALLQIPGAELAYLCDVDDQRLDRTLQSLLAHHEKPPKAVKDFRRILDDKSVDALFIAAPNFWHAPATILACAAGKHVYVEKPGSHNPHESELMVAAARKHQRVVQMGNQRRSWPGIIEGMEKIRAGAVGKLLYARAWFTGARPSIGRGKPVAVPSTLDYNAWQGPVPERPYLDNLVHYNWHWRWHWGGGELANNGIHALDLVRWGLGVDYPRRVTFNGGRYHFQDDQETPDTGSAVFDFGRTGASLDNSSCHPRANENLAFVTFYGEGGSASFNLGSGYKLYDDKGKEVGQGSGETGDKIHITNFLDCIRTGRRPNSEIAEGQKSTLLCHLGNIAYRTGHGLEIDPLTGHILNDKKAQALWRREYRHAWEPRV